MRFLPVALLAASLSVLSSLAHTQGNAQAGFIKSDDERCHECHGADGNGDMGDGVGNIGKFPKLAGQNIDYLLKQLRDFRSGARDNDTMSIMAKSVNEPDLIDITAYYSSLPTMQGDGGGDKAKLQKIRTLYVQGDPARGLLPCQSCHGEAGKGGVDPGIPIIGGQHVRYLQKQLTEWRAAERKNSPGDIMRQVTNALSDAEIEAFSDYLSRQ
ncbi:MAG: cytochrome c4 [Zoogloeaceae bacterium]|jgi:cytochrome c553|nr:cytochrome c4 [Zoogloeaceae bacterium]